jgi:hypothetical protein
MWLPKPLIITDAQNTTLSQTKTPPWKQANLPKRSHALALQPVAGGFVPVRMLVTVLIHGVWGIGVGLILALLMRRRTAAPRLTHRRCHMPPPSERPYAARCRGVQKRRG